MSNSAPTIASTLASEARPRRSVPWMLVAVIVVLLAIAAACVDWFFVGRFVESTDDAYVGGDVTVMAPKVGGFVATVLV